MEREARYQERSYEEQPGEGGGKGDQESSRNNTLRRIKRERVVVDSGKKERNKRRESAVELCMHILVFHSGEST